MRKSPKILSLLLMLLVACGAAEIEPVPIENEDTCSFCRMAITEKQFAAEIVTNDSVWKFDDVGCLLRFQQNAGDKVKGASIFVTDYDSRKWLKAEKAFFVRSKEIKTPMASGIIAYADRAKAGNDAVRFEDLRP